MNRTTFTISFLTHCLAHSPGTIPDRFVRSGDQILLTPAQWHAALGRAVPLSGVEANPADIQPELTFSAPTRLWRRRYGADQYRTHETIWPGTEVSLRAVTQPCLSEDQLRRILTALGSFVGISPFGHRLGFGRFRLLSLTQT